MRDKNYVPSAYYPLDISPLIHDCIVCRTIALQIVFSLFLDSRSLALRFCFFRVKCSTLSEEHV